MDLKQKNRRTTRRLVLVAVGMFGFGFALWPLYTVLCEVTGLGGRAVQVSENNDQAEASERVVNIRFDASVNSSLPWEFRAVDKVQQYNLGVPSRALYVATNPGNESVTGQATYNVSPPEASLYFVKTECFCFTEQVLAANESREMPVYFYVKSDLPEHIKDITLSYTFYQLGYEPSQRTAHH